jgi:prevent-host-death family protein
MPMIAVVAKKASPLSWNWQRIRYAVFMTPARQQRREHRAKIAKARNVLGEVISRARFAGETTILVNRGKEAAVLVPYEFYVRATEALGEERVLVSDDAADSES